MPKERLDKILVARGLVDSRSRAQALILAGQVLVAEQRVDKPGHAIEVDANIRIKGERLRYVSRGGLKLEKALRDFKIDPAEKICLDVGASTGGFADCLLQHGAARVWAVDVGHNQLAWSLRQDSRIVVIEGQNARSLKPDQFDQLFDLATIDVVFISLTQVLLAVRDCLISSGDCVALIKPQFEVGKGEVERSGVVTDPRKHRRVLERITTFATENKFNPINLIESPIRGAEGNREFLIHLTPDSSASPRIDFNEVMEQLTSSESA